MPRSAKIPLRPKDFSTSLSQMEQAAITWYVLSGCSKKEAFITFARPDMLGSRAKAAIDDYVNQFFAQKDVKDYIAAYDETISEFLNPKKKTIVDSVTVEEKKSKALTKLVEYVLSEANHIEESDDPKAILDYANKIGIFDVSEKVEELPRRYLPLSPCLTGCAYRMFCEENAEDMCQYCKYHQYGEENGVHYDKTEILDAPIKVAGLE